MKSQHAVAHQTFLGAMNIKTLLGISCTNAKKVFAAADRLDTQELTGFRIDLRLVRITSVCQATGLSINLLDRQTQEGRKDTK